MNRMWNDNTTLEQMQRQIGELCQDKLGQGVLICNVLDLDREDYRIMYEKSILIKNPWVFRDYPIVLIACWALSYKYGKSDDVISAMRENMGHIQQHHTRIVMDMFISAFYEYRIDTFGISFHTLSDVRRVIERHHE